MKENIKKKAAKKLINGLKKGEKSAQKTGYIDIEHVEKILGVKI